MIPSNNFDPVSSNFYSSAKQPLSCGIDGYNQLTRLMAKDKSPEKVLESIDQYSNLLALDHDGFSLIHWTAYYAAKCPETCFKLMQKLLTDKADINCLSSEGLIPMQILCNRITDLENGEKWIKLFLSAGASIEHEDNENKSSIDHLIENKQLPLAQKIKLINLLIENTDESKRKNSYEKIFTNLLNTQTPPPISLNELAILLQEYGDKLNLNNISGRPILHLLFASFQHEEIKDLCEVAEIAFSKGANPNILDCNGKPLLIRFIKLVANSLHLSTPEETYQNLKSGLVTLMSMGALPYLAVDDNKCGCIAYILSSFEVVLSESELNDIFQILYGKDLYTEIQMQELLVNSFEISKHTFTFNHEKFELEGTFALNNFLKPHISLLIGYYKELIEQLCDPSDKPKYFLDRILTRCGMTHFTDNEIKQIITSLQTASEILSKTTTNEAINPRTLHKKIKKSLPLAMLASHHVIEANTTSAHAVGYYFTEKMMMMSNSGYLCGQYPGISFHKKTKNLKKFTKDLYNRKNLVSFLMANFPQRIDVRGPIVLKTLKYIRQQPQLIGNCPLKSFGGLEVGVLYEQLNKFFGTDSAEKLAKAIKTEGHALRREQLLMSYLARHTPDTTTQLPLANKSLLIKLLSIKSRDNILIQERRSRILHWFDLFDKETYTRLTSAQNEVEGLNQGFCPSTPNSLPQTPTSPHSFSESFQQDAFFSSYSYDDTEQYSFSDSPMEEVCPKTPDFFHRFLNEHQPLSESFQNNAPFTAYLHYDNQQYYDSDSPMEEVCPKTPDFSPKPPTEEQLLSEIFQNNELFGSYTHYDNQQYYSSGSPRENLAPKTPGSPTESSRAYTLHSECSDMDREIRDLWETLT